MRRAALNYDDDDCAAQCGEAGAELAEALDAYWDSEVLSEGQLNAYYRKMFIVSVQKAEECAAATDQSMSAIEACLGVTLPALGAGGVHNPLYGSLWAMGHAHRAGRGLGLISFRGVRTCLTPAGEGQCLAGSAVPSGHSVIGL